MMMKKSGASNSSMADIVFMSSRRLLYVACTRAQCLLYLTHAESRMSCGTTKESRLSPFLTCISTSPEVRVILKISMCYSNHGISRYC
jgi:hypothetical protein